MQYLKRIFNPHPLSKTYDTLTTETSQILHNPFTPNLKTETTLSLFPNLQLTSLFLSGTQKFYQIGCLLSTQDSLYQATYDKNENIQFRLAKQFYNTTAKFHSMVSKKDGVYSQAEFDVSLPYTNFSLKSICANVGKNRPFFVVSGLQSLNDKISVGGEVVCAGDLSVSLAGRIENKNSVSVVTMQNIFSNFISKNCNGCNSIGSCDKINNNPDNNSNKKNINNNINNNNENIIENLRNIFNIQNIGTLNYTYYKKLNKLLSLGMEINANGIRKSIDGGVGVKLETKRGCVVVDIDSEKKSRISIEQKIGEGVVFKMGSEIEFGSGKQEFGFGISFER